MSKYFSGCEENITDSYNVSVDEIIMAAKNSAPWVQQAYTYGVPIIGLFIFVANLSVVISSSILVKKGVKPRSTYLLLGNLSMADMIKGMSIFIASVYPKKYVIRSHYGCIIQMGLIIATVVASAYTVTLIAIDRFLYIIHGLTYHRLVYLRRVRCVIIVTWVFALSFGILPLLLWSKPTMEGTRCWFILIAPKELIVVTCIVGIVPILSVTVLYSIILCKAINTITQLKSITRYPKQDCKATEDSSNLRLFKGGNKMIKSASKNSDENIEWTPSTSQDSAQPLSVSSNKLKKITSIWKNKKNAREKSSPSKWKAFKIVLLTTGAFILTWMPYLIACLAFVFCDNERTPERCQLLKYLTTRGLSFLGSVNCILNPIIYAWWHKGFRNAIKNIYLKKKRLKLKSNPR